MGGRLCQALKAATELLLNCHVGAMLVFRLLCRITQSSDAHRTESVSVMAHEQTMEVNFTAIVRVLRVGSMKFSNHLTLNYTLNST